VPFLFHQPNHKKEKKMENQINQTFRSDEVSLIKHWDKRREEWIKTVHPRIGGRLRLAHEQNENISIDTEIYKYDETAGIAVVVATCRTAKGTFKGIGMSSVERDEKVAPAILEMAETRGIARALRFAGFGVEYCSAEEISHLENGNGNGVQPPAKENHHELEPPSGKIEIGFQPVDDNVYKPRFNVISNAQSEKGFKRNGGNGNGSKQMTVKQFSYIQSFGRKLSLNLEQLNQKSVEMFNCELAYLSSREASTFIDNVLHGQK
jgi:hypothetical protein